MTTQEHRARERGFSLVGLLITLVCIVVLFSISMNSLNKAVTGQGSTTEGSVRSFEDRMALYSFYQTFHASANDSKGRFLTPSVLNGSDDKRYDDTAALFSAMVMQNYAVPAQLVSANERSDAVWIDEDYDFTVYSPSSGVYWDPSFSADLMDLSNTSFANMPLYGSRFERHWAADFTSGVPIFGNRGPKDGIDDPTSMTYGRSGTWAGWIIYADGKIEFTETFVPGSAWYQKGGERLMDNIFAMEDGPDGGDAILAFTKQMRNNGPVLQFD